MGLSRNEAPYVKIPLNTVIELRPKAFHCSVEVRIPLHDICDNVICNYLATYVVYTSRTDAQ